MSLDGLDEWDEKFLDEAVRVELEVISSRNSSVLPLADPPSARSDPAPSSSFFVFDGGRGDHSFSPPRELSQRPLADACDDGRRLSGGSIKKDRDRDSEEIKRLKKELGRLTKQLGHMEHECAELRKYKLEKDEQLKLAFGQIKAKDSEINIFNHGNLKGFQPADENIKTRHFEDSAITIGSQREAVAFDGPFPVSELKQQVLIDKKLMASKAPSLQENSYLGRNSQHMSNKAIGVQTDLVPDCNDVVLKDNRYMQHDLSRKLCTIWGIGDQGLSGRDLVSKLFITCSTEFGVLFRCINMGLQTNLGFQPDKTFPDVTLNGDLLSFKSTDVAKVSHLYATLMKMHKNMVWLDVLVKAFLDVCTIENAVFLHCSLRILHAILQQCQGFDGRCNGRDNILMEQCSHKSLSEERNKEKKSLLPEFVKVCYDNVLPRFSLKKEDFDLGYLFNDKGGSSSNMYLSFESRVSLFDLMLQIITRSIPENVCIEALSIMNLILMRSDPYSERDKFNLLPILRCVAKLLEKDISLLIQVQAIHILFLILNCPKMLTMFCGRNDVFDHSETGGHQDSSTLDGAVSCVLEGLTASFAQLGIGAQELKYRKRVIILLAFIASSGKSGFEVLRSSITPKGVNFLELIMQVLASEMDAEIVDPAKVQDLHHERNLFFREALILLNRLASHPTYSKATLGALTNRNAVASLTIDVANRLASKSRSCQIGGIVKMTHTDAELVDLARQFKTRVFAFIGESAS